LLHHLCLERSALPSALQLPKCPHKTHQRLPRATILVTHNRILHDRVPLELASPRIQEPASRVLTLTWLSRSCGSCPEADWGCSGTLRGGRVSTAGAPIAFSSASSIPRYCCTILPYPASPATCGGSSGRGLPWGPASPSSYWLSTNMFGGDFFYFFIWGVVRCLKFLSLASKMHVQGKAGGYLWKDFQAWPGGAVDAEFCEHPVQEAFGEHQVTPPKGVPPVDTVSRMIRCVFSYINSITHLSILYHGSTA
jgi:hypothetical protein